MKIEEFLDTYPNEIAGISKALRVLIRAQAHDSSEELHVGWRVISYGLNKKFCAIAPHGKWVNLQFHEGALLEDPAGLLEGTGQSMRHVKIKSDQDLSGDLAALILAAGDNAQ
jgi:hypothetical protein